MISEEVGMGMDRNKSDWELDWGEGRFWGDGW